MIYPVVPDEKTMELLRNTTDIEKTINHIKDVKNIYFFRIIIPKN